MPTPLIGHREPDLRFVTDTLDMVVPYLRPGQVAFSVDALMNDMVILALGVDGFNFSYANSAVPNEHAHNDFLTALTEFGIAGALLFFVWPVALLRSFLCDLSTSDRNLGWMAVVFPGIYLGLLTASQFEPTFCPTINTLPFMRIVVPLLLIVSLFRFRERFGKSV